MDRKEFSARFHDAIDLTIAYTKQLCFNDISPVYQFIVSPNSSKTSVILEDMETEHVQALKDLHLRPLFFDEVLDMLQVGDKHPLWINISVYEAAQDVTFIELLCSRRLRKIEDMPNNVDRFPPFHVWVPAPTDKGKKKTNNKFDVNWRSVEDKNKGLLDKIKSYFS